MVIKVARLILSVSFLEQDEERFPHRFWFYDINSDLTDKEASKKSQMLSFPQGQTLLEADLQIPACIHRGLLSKTARKGTHH